MKEIKLLGFKATDRVTGFRGVITTIAFDLYGCIMAIVTPESDKNANKDGQWFDIKRLVVDTNNGTVMEQPTFESVPGGDAKSLPPERQ